MRRKEVAVTAWRGGERNGKDVSEQRSRKEGRERHGGDKDPWTDGQAENVNTQRGMAG